MNSVQLIGRLTRDPEVRYTASQMAVATFSVAIDRPTRAGSERQTDFPRVTVFGKQAENCEKYLAKGSPSAGSMIWRLLVWPPGPKQKHSSTVRLE